MAYLKIFQSLHEGNTKFYEVILSRNSETNESYLTQHWGKVGTHGQFKHTSYASSRGAELEAAKIISGKQKRGYDFLDEKRTEVEVDNATQLYRNIQLKINSIVASDVTDHLSQVFKGSARVYRAEDEDEMYGRPRSTTTAPVFYDELQGSW